MQEPLTEEFINRYLRPPSDPSQAPSPDLDELYAIEDQLAALVKPLGLCTLSAEQRDELQGPRSPNLWNVMCETADGLRACDRARAAVRIEPGAFETAALLDMSLGGLIRALFTLHCAVDTGFLLRAAEGNRLCDQIDRAVAAAARHPRGTVVGQTVLTVQFDEPQMRRRKAQASAEPALEVQPAPAAMASVPGAEPAPGEDRAAGQLGLPPVATVLIRRLVASAARAKPAAGRRRAGAAVPTIRSLLTSPRGVDREGRIRRPAGVDLEGLFDPPQQGWPAGLLLQPEEVDLVTNRLCAVVPRFPLHGLRPEQKREYRRGYYPQMPSVLPAYARPVRLYPEIYADPEGLVDLGRRLTRYVSLRHRTARWVNQAMDLRLFLGAVQRYLQREVLTQVVALLEAPGCGAAERQRLETKFGALLVDKQRLLDESARQRGRAKEAREALARETEEINRRVLVADVLQAIRLGQPVDEETLELAARYHHEINPGEPGAKQERPARRRPPRRRST